MNLAQTFRFLTRFVPAMIKERNQAQEKPKGWIEFRCDWGETHCVPREDIKGHILFPDCDCQPAQPQEGFFIHRSYDGRELVDRTELGLPLL